MTGRHAKPKRSRHSGPVIDDDYETESHDAETLAVFADINRPLRLVQAFAGTTYARTRSIPAALAITSLIRAYAARTKSGDTK